MKKIVLLVFMFFVALTTANAQYSNATLSGPWLLYQNPLTPYNDSLVYIIFDGNGSITDFGGFGTFSGSYTVNATGSFSGILNMDEGSFPLSGQLTSQNKATMGDRILSRVTNPGALSGTISGVLNSACGSATVTLTVDNQGKITGATGLTAPVTGRIYTDLGVYIGHIKTGSEIAHWNEFSMMGYYADNKLNGKVGLNAGPNDCKSSVNQLIHTGATEINSITPGALSTILTTEELNSVTNLKLKGSIDARDFKTMRSLMPELTSVDLSGVSIMAYTGTEGTYNTSNYSYPANTIPRSGLYNKTKLQNLILPDNLIAIARSGLNSCTSLTSVSLPTGMKSIGYLAFSNCSSLNNFTIPETVNVIDTSAFMFCSSLPDIEIPASVTLIGSTAFLGTNANVNVNSSNAYYSSENGVLYDKNKSILMYCPPNSAAGFKIPATVTEIDIDAFYNCHELDNITLPNSLIRIKQWAFENCTGLRSVNIPASVSEIQGYAFYNCSGLNTLITRSATPVDLSASDSVFKHVDVANCTLYVPVGSKSSYQNAVQWKDFQNILEEDNTIELNKGIIAWYPFNGNANDESGNNNNGTVHEATLSPDRFGNGSKAYYFNGISNYISIDGIIDDLLNKESYSVTGWFKSANPEHKGTIFSINKEKNTIGQNISMIVWENNLTYYSDSITNSQYHLTPFDNEIWHFFALTFTKNQISRLFIDSNILHHTFISNMSITPNSMASIGQEWDNEWTSDFFVGWIDDIRIYDRVINSSERGMLYAENTTGMNDVKTIPISIYPNPVENGFYLPTKVNVANISIYDVRGALVLRALNTNNYVDVSSLQRGIYIVQIQAKEGIYPVKLIKK